MGKKRIILFLLFVLQSFSLAQLNTTMQNFSLAQLNTEMLSHGSSGLTANKFTSEAPPPSGIPTDGLIAAWEVEKDRGVGVNTFSTDMTSLIGDNVLHLVNTPTDSTAFGYIWFTYAGTEYAISDPFDFSAPFTVVIKATGFYQGEILAYVVDFAAGGSLQASMVNWNVDPGLLGQVGRWGDFTHSGNGTTDYIQEYINWGDSVTTFTSEVKVYRDGFLRVDDSGEDLSGTVNSSVIHVFGNPEGGWYALQGRFYCLYLYSRVLTPEEIQLFNTY